MPFENEKTSEGKWQTVDKERDIVLINTGSHPDYGYEFDLYYAGARIKFSGDPGMKIHGQPKLGETRQYEMNWKIFRMFIPPQLYERKEEIFQIIRESLEVWGWNYGQDKAYSVNVDFIKGLKV